MNQLAEQLAQLQKLLSNPLIANLMSNPLMAGFLQFIQTFKIYKSQSKFLTKTHIQVSPAQLNSIFQPQVLMTNPTLLNSAVLPTNSGDTSSSHAFSVNSAPSTVTANSASSPAATPNSSSSPPTTNSPPNGANVALQPSLIHFLNFSSNLTFFHKF